jgi:hypothetical protein
LPGVDGGLAPARKAQFARGCVGGDGGPGADGRAFADPHRRDQCGVGTDERAIADFGDELVDTVVVAGDGAGADVDVAANLGVAEIGEMVGLAAFAQLGLLGFDEVAHVCAGREFGAGPQARERADPAGAVGRDAFQVAVPQHFGTGREVDVAQPAERTDPHAIAEGDAVLQDHVHVDLDVASMAEMPAQVEPCGIGDPHPCQHQAPCVAAAQVGREFRELRGIVGAEGFDGIARHHHVGR